MKCKINIKSDLHLVNPYNFVLIFFHVLRLHYNQTKYKILKSKIKKIVHSP